MTPAPMKRIKSACALILVTLFLTTVAAVAMQRGQTRRVRFARGRTTAILKGAVVRGTTDRYILGARSGQTMTVHITSLEQNAVFTIYAPNRETLAGAGEGNDAMDWSGELPRSGNYVIEVGGTRGNATYTLEVSIR